MIATRAVNLCMQNEHSMSCAFNPVLNENTWNVRSLQLSNLRNARSLVSISMLRRLRHYHTDKSACISDRVLESTWQVKPRGIPTFRPPRRGPGNPHNIWASAQSNLGISISVSSGVAYFPRTQRGAWLISFACHMPALILFKHTFDLRRCLFASTSRYRFLESTLTKHQGHSLSSLITMSVDKTIFKNSTRSIKLNGEA